ncbi:MAG: peptidase M19 [Flammeovirgaceae bacterium]|nr:peptidase M19 [Flammeovirgaceae bacterium]
MNHQSEKLSRENIIIDGHIDLPFRLYKKNLLFEKKIELDKETSGNFDIPKAVRGGLNCPFMSIYIPSDKNFDEAFVLADNLIDLVDNVIKSNQKNLSHASGPSDVEKNFFENKISLPMGMENGSALGKDINNIKYFFSRGIRYLTLTHAKDNQICDSSYDSKRTWNGLSDFGVEVIKEMNKIGMMVDVSHISDKTFYDVLKISRKPLVATHSSPRKFTPSFERNMSDEMIIDLAENGGIIMINFGSSFVNQRSNKIFSEIEKKVKGYKTKKNIKNDHEELERYKNELINEMNPFAKIEDVVKTIDHVYKLVGIDHIGFGSDFDGLGNSLPEGLKDVSMYPNIIERLLKKNYSEEDIKKICYKNLFRVWNANLQNHQT